MKTGLMTHREGFCTGTAKSVSQYDIYLSESRFTGISVYRCTLTSYENRFLYATGTSTARGKHFVYMHVISTIIVKEQNSLILICSRMKELTFSRFITELRGRNGFRCLLFTGKTALLMKNSGFFQRWQPILALVCCVLGSRGYFGSLKWLLYG